MYRVSSSIIRVSTKQTHMVSRNIREKHATSPRACFLSDFCQGNFSQICRGKEKKNWKMTIYGHCLSMSVAAEAYLYNLPYLACKKITFQLLPLCYDICRACRCLASAWGEKRGFKIKDVLSPADSNSTGPPGQATNVGLKKSLVSSACVCWLVPE